MENIVKRVSQCVHATVHYFSFQLFIAFKYFNYAIYRYNIRTSLRDNKSGEEEGESHFKSSLFLATFQHQQILFPPPPLPYSSHTIRKY